MKNIAVVLAGGSGKRMGEETPKQFLQVMGKPIIQYSMEAFQNHPLIDEMVVVLPDEYVGNLNQFVDIDMFPKLEAQLGGGSERYLSTLAALRYYTSENDANILFHDAARPLVTQEIISNVLYALNQFEAVCVAIPTTDTVIETTENGFIHHYPKRQQMVNAQTPQAFNIKVIKQAFNMAMQDTGFFTTDDCSIVHKYLPHIPIKIVPGSIKNFKITNPTDLQIILHQMNK
ncbi:MAG: 2-C-methyl-D-erythritol 4-phosphate cytidylyltransferase [Bacteroidales bacterium]|jgi:2-C-methyl-D-erythritol 4-phosphate cytidylyltransferase|nr:2-C-methyl-D-erythritol 4-phosphate cytidylyltransferase [Bacteroidales bacterium]